MVFIQVKYGYLSGGSEYMDAVAQAIAEADGMYYDLRMRESAYISRFPQYATSSIPSTISVVRFTRSSVTALSLNSSGLIVKIYHR